VIVDAVTRSFFGNHLHNIDPDIVEHMISFNRYAWMVVFGFGTGLFETPVAKPQKALMAALMKFIQSPADQKGEEAWVLKQLLPVMDLVGIDVESRAAMLLMSYWA
jgi:cholesterol 7alpha-monooxygenase